MVEHDASLIWPKLTNDVVIIRHADGAFFQSDTGTFVAESADTHDLPAAPRIARWRRGSAAMWRSKRSRRWQAGSAGSHPRRDRADRDSRRWRARGVRTAAAPVRQYLRHEHVRICVSTTSRFAPAWMTSSRISRRQKNGVGSLREPPVQGEEKR
jgi:hypothetical protein